MGALTLLIRNMGGVIAGGQKARRIEVGTARPIKNAESAED